MANTSKRYTQDEKSSKSEYFVKVGHRRIMAQKELGYEVKR